ncbi:hypothetical protein EDB92DRAFT_1991341 [Lactarius akahatsu]|uniref:Autophagy-related protein 14 n=1 Tax=Lactarius akahatsu TaxID=416441 RepID=A0AAD4LG45_9AGAM|nr:hypothetical protein EDB92DRAFT_1991341 [Lactarius akahatsu]
METDSHSHGRRRGETNGVGSNPSGGLLTPVEYQNCAQHLLRHITRIQIRNFTPFPARDAFASALTQPSEQSQFTSYGSLSDDLDVALSRKRTRKTSSTSIMTIKSRLDGHTSDDSWAVGSASPPDLRARKRTVSRVSTRESPASVGPGNHPPLSGTGTASRTNRPRTQSMSSSVSGKAVVPTTTQWQSHTQKTLEKVLRSRLVETFVTVTVPSTFGEHGSLAKPASASHAHRPTSRESPASNRNLRPPQGTPPRSTSSSREEQHTKRISRTATAVSTDKTASTRKVAASPTKLNGNASKPRSLKADNETRTVPNFISNIHNPSTNPDFALDIHDFSKQTDPSATHVIVQLWAKLHQDRTSVSKRDKGKEQTLDEVDISDPQWKAAGHWDVCLADLVPLPDEIAAQPSSLPSNTLLLTLSPPGKTFYIPVAPSLGPTRSPSPSNGYNSDPESHASGVLLVSKSATPRRKDFSLPRTKAREPHARYAATSSWHDLVKLVNLQCAIIDTRQLLSEDIRNVDGLFAPPNVNWLTREVSERESRLADWRAAEAQARVELGSLSDRIRERKEELKCRRALLSSAMVMLSQDVTAEAILEQELSRERDTLAALQRRIPSIRVTLISTLSSLFPIDLISGSDLLFSVLGVPLPIPIGATDPAPPLSLPAYKDVNEETVATALAYAALVVQLLATYLGKLLVYPITFCGSRSMIRDGISAMVGPRMFPLFSKGVDTYRFEYGVFLLNKNIEMLMSDRNLRALDMRHTLPNLKNLLLTLSDGEGASLGDMRSSTTSLTGLESPVRPLSPKQSSSTVSTSTMATELPEAADESPPHSGSTTPSKASIDTHHGSFSRMSRPFLGLSGFLRSRYPSSAQRPSVKAVPESLENGVENENGEEGQMTGSTDENSSDDDDRRTLRGVPVNSGGEDVKEVVRGGEKETEDSKVPVPVGEDGETLAVSRVLTHI